MEPKKVRSPFRLKSGEIKVPFRAIYCTGWKVWLSETIRCHLVVRLNPPIVPKLGE